MTGGIRGPLEIHVVNTAEESQVIKARWKNIQIVCHPVDHRNFHIKLFGTDEMENKAWAYRAKVEERKDLAIEHVICNLIRRWWCSLVTQCTEYELVQLSSTKVR